MSNHRTVSIDAFDVERLSGVFKALGHPERLRIVARLLARELACCDANVDSCEPGAGACNVSELADGLSIAPSTVSHHLRELANAGLVHRTRDGRFHWISVDTSTLSVLADWLDPKERQAERNDLEVTDASHST